MWRRCKCRRCEWQAKGKGADLTHAIVPQSASGMGSRLLSMRTEHVLDAPRVRFDRDGMPRTRDAPTLWRPCGVPVLWFVLLSPTKEGALSQNVSLFFLGIYLISNSTVWSEGGRVAPERPRAGRWVEGGRHAVGQAARGRSSTSQSTS